MARPTVSSDTQLLIGTYNGVRSNTWGDDAVVDEGIESRNQTFTLAYAYVTSLHGRSGGPGFALPVSSMLSYDEATNQVIQDASGIGDLNLTFDYNLFGAPSLPVRGGISIRACACSATTTITPAARRSRRNLFMPSRPITAAMWRARRG